MVTITKFEDLEVWQMAREFYVELVPLFKKLREKKDYRFADQLKSAAGSIMDNIAEGFERSSKLEFINSLSISKGENGEVKSQLYRALDEAHLDQNEFQFFYSRADHLGKKIANLIRYLNTSEIRGLKFKDRLNPK